MSKLCRQVSIESPGLANRDLVLSFVVPVPETPATGARVKVVYAGACYQRNRSASLCSQSSSGAELTDSLFALKQAMIAEAAAAASSTAQHHHHQHQHSMSSSPPNSITHPSPAHHGIRDGALFPGFEVAGVIEQLGDDVSPNSGFHVGQRVCLYPFDAAPNGYAEYIVVPELRFLIPVPDTLSLSVAAMLPTGALLAMNTVDAAHQIAASLLADRDPVANPCRILIVGTGGLALWAVRIAMNHAAQNQKVHEEHVRITVASLRDEGFHLAKDLKKLVFFHWFCFCCMIVILLNLCFFL